MIVHQESIEIRLDKEAVRARLLGLTLPTTDSAHAEEVTLRVPATLQRQGGKNRIVLANTLGRANVGKQVPSLVKAVAGAYDWMRRIEAGEFKNQRTIAAPTGLDEHCITRILAIDFLALKTVEEILDRTQPLGLSLDKLLKGMSLHWSEQGQIVSD